MNSIFFLNEWHLKWWNLLNGIFQESKWSWTHNFPKTCTNSLWSSVPSFVAKMLIILSTWRHVNLESHDCTALLECGSVGSPKVKFPDQIPLLFPCTFQIFSGVWYACCCFNREICGTEPCKYPIPSGYTSHIASIPVFCSASPEVHKSIHSHKACRFWSWDLHAITLFLLSASRMSLLKKPWHI